MRLRTGYLDKASENIDEALAMIRQSCADKMPISVGLLGNAPRYCRNCSSAVSGPIC